MVKEFEAKGGTSQAIQPLGKTLSDYAFAQANEFIDFGQTPREAGSIVANMLLQVGWEVAACGALADGATPDKDKFRSCVEAVLDRVSFSEETPSLATNVLSTTKEPDHEKP